MRLLTLTFGLSAAFAAPTYFTVSIGHAAWPLRSVPPSFIGFSGAEATLGVLSSPTPEGFAPRPSFARLMKLLDAPSIRFGHIWGASDGVRPSHVPASYIQVNESLGERLSACAQMWNCSVTLMIPPIYTDNASFVTQTGAAVAAHVPLSLLRGLELANEPDISSFKDNFTAWRDALTRWRAGLATVLPTPIISAPVLAGDAWWPEMPSLLQTFNASSLTRFVQHRYALGACHGTPTIAGLMNSSTTWLTPQDAALLSAVAAAKLDFIVGEGNTVACNGTSGVSDVFASALYVISALLDAVAAGVSHYAWHGLGDPVPGFSYQPILYDPTRLTTVGWDVAQVRPLFLGLWAFAEAIKRGSTLLNVTTGGDDSRGSLLRAWATRDADGAVERAIILHKDASVGDVGVSVTPSSPCAPGDVATLSRLLSGPDGFAARSGSSWRGRSFDGTTDGVPVGDAADERVSCDGGGRYSFTLARASAAILAWAA